MPPRALTRLLLPTAFAIAIACSSSSEDAASTPEPQTEAGIVLDAGADADASVDADADAPGLDARPPSEIIITAPGSPYAIDTREITIAEYMQYRAAPPAVPSSLAGCGWKTSLGPAPGCALPSGDPARPMTCIDWCDAQAYCAAHGKHLCARIGGGSATTTAQRVDPLTDEWVRACGGPVPGERWPYGTTASPGACNTLEHDAGGTVVTGALAGCKGEQPEVFDMSGNAAEWEDSCLLQDGGTGDAAADTCAVRGGSFLDTNANAKCTSIAELARAEASPAVGARCCKDLQQ